MAENKVLITRRATFEACHSLPNYEGKCARLHGHSYKLEVTVEGTVDYDHMEKSESHENSREAMVVDFSFVKSMIDMCIVNKYDHRNLNDFFNYPTAEIMAIKFFEDLSALINNKSGTQKVVAVKLWETENSYAEYFGERVGESK